MTGRGTEKWRNGNVYEGLFKDYYRHGQGTYRWADGSVYDGEWCQNNKHGKGTFGDS
jgi:hypothetical protein